MFLLANGETQIKKCARASQRGKAAKLSGGISVGAQPTNFDLQRVRVGGMPFGTPKMVNYEDPRSVGFGLEKVEIICTFGEGFSFKREEFNLCMEACLLFLSLFRIPCEEWLRNWKL